MQYPFALSFLALFIAVILIAQSAITINNYNKTNQGKDLNYYWSNFVLILGIIAAIVSMIGMFMYRESAHAVISGAVAPAAVPVAVAPAAPTA